MDALTLIRDRVLPCYEGLAGATVEEFGSGLINQTFVVRAASGRFVLQRVSPVFPATIHENIAAVTRALGTAGLITPRLVPARDGRPCLELGEAGVWRVLTFVDGVSFDVVAGPAQARAAGALLARFHRTLEGVPHRFVGMRAGVHDTPAHLERLRQALASGAAHRLYPQVRALGEAILAGAAALPPLPAIPDRVCHGDPKFNNILFAGSEGAAREQAVCLIDLDTVGPMPLAHELGDAWRSWCNRSGEDATGAELDLEVFRASLEGYREGRGAPLGADERRALLLGVEWISLELAARFAADAIFESYFGWNPARHAGRGEHNLVRATGQWSLHQAFVGTRDERARLLAG